MKLLKNNNIEVKTIELNGEAVRARLASDDDQTRAQEVLRPILGSDYPVALADIQTTPDWLQSLGGAPMYLGLDLRGGVHFLLQVDMEAAQKTASENYVDDIKKLFRDNKLYNSGVTQSAAGAINVGFKTEELRDQASNQLSTSFPELQTLETEKDGRFLMSMKLSEQADAEIRSAALKKNIIAIRNRIDQLGVSEPVIQQQGTDRIVVQLPGVRDPSEAKDILGKTATLEVRMVDEENALESTIRGRVPVGSKRFFFRDKTPILLKSRLIYSGENIIDASAGFDSQSGGPTVSITLDAKGSNINSDITGKNIGKRMAVVYVENVTDIKIDSKGEQKITKKRIEEVITAPVIRDQLGKRFQITGLESPRESQDLALLLRAGSLAAPVYIIEERTVGPSLGKENI